MTDNLPKEARTWRVEGDVEVGVLVGHPFMGDPPVCEFNELEAVYKLHTGIWEIAKPGFAKPLPVTDKVVFYDYQSKQVCIPGLSMDQRTFILKEKQAIRALRRLHKKKPRSAEPNEPCIPTDPSSVSGSALG